MAVFKKDIITFSNGRQIKVPGGIFTIISSLELADYYSRLVFFYDHDSKNNKEITSVKNIYNLTKEELIEVADCMIALWIDLKDNVRRYGVDNPEIFNVRL
ncbi:hypothetical protein [Niastella sp. OAS944]|uniref:hypothetical protein n=1 Tax=Niastella sp. OAS944 TaxID=2664089 RepID=UPI0034800DA4|nr:hypothetical protein [Chitinophagaceae bacterium OAS944]